MAAENRFADILTKHRQSKSEKNPVKSNHIYISDFWISKHEKVQFAFLHQPLNLKKKKKSPHCMLLEPKQLECFVGTLADKRRNSEHLQVSIKPRGLVIKKMFR